jgi:hypothetical protein
MKCIDVKEIAQTDIIAGKLKGKMVLAQLIQETDHQSSTEPLYLDFQSIELATSSFFREAILGFRDYCITQNLNLVPIVANANQQTLDEFLVVLENKGDAIVVCDLYNGQVSNPRIIGVLEEKQAITLEAVIQAKEIDAVSLEERFRAVERIGATSWNNRLASLAAKGILIERKKGRLKLYRPILEVKYGY